MRIRNVKCRSVWFLGSSVIKSGGFIKLVIKTELRRFFKCSVPDLWPRHNISKIFLVHFISTFTLKRLLKNDICKLAVQIVYRKLAGLRFLPRGFNFLPLVCQCVLDFVRPPCENNACIHVIEKLIATCNFLMNG